MHGTHSNTNEFWHSLTLSLFPVPMFDDIIISFTQKFSSDMTKLHCNGNLNNENMWMCDSKLCMFYSLMWKSKNTYSVHVNQIGHLYRKCILFDVCGKQVVLFYEMFNEQLCSIVQSDDAYDGPLVLSQPIFLRQMLRCFRSKCKKIEEGWPACEQAIKTNSIIKRRWSMKDLKTKKKCAQRERTNAIWKIRTMKCWHMSEHFSTYDESTIDSWYRIRILYKRVSSCSGCTSVSQQKNKIFSFWLWAEKTTNTNRTCTCMLYDMQRRFNLQFYLFKR